MKQNICFFVLVALMLGCKNENPSTPQQTQETLSGVWQEQFNWYQLPDFQGVSDSQKKKLITVTFQGTYFTVLILPPHEVIIPPSLTRSLSSDTLYSGTYTLFKDTISFSINGQNIPKRFSIQIFSDSLRMSALGVKINDSLFALEKSFFLWGNSSYKNSGVFKRAH